MGAPAKDSTITLVHQLLVLDANLVANLIAPNKAGICRWLVDDLLAGLKMNVLAPLQLYDAVDVGAPGWSFIQPITTSHISGHYFEKEGEPPHIHIDIYSCKHVNYQVALGVIHNHLNLADWAATHLIRDARSFARQYIELAGHGATIRFESALSACQSNAAGTRR